MMSSDKLRVRIFDAFIPVAALLIAAVVLLVCLFRPQPQERVAEVTVDGKTVAILPLSEDAEKQVTVADGFNLVIVRDGKVTVAEADCETQVCVHHRAVSRVGESIVCAPHGLVVTVVGEGEAPDLIV